MTRSLLSDTSHITNTTCFTFVMPDTIDHYGVLVVVFFLIRRILFTQISAKMLNEINYTTTNKYIT